MREFNYGSGRQLITPNSFPLPAIAVQGDLRPEDVSGFADKQAKAANVVGDRLDSSLASKPEADWPDTFAELHGQLVSWRYWMAVDQGKSAAQAERFTMPITDETPNINPLGSDVGFLHKDSAWNEELGRYAGGEELVSKLP